MFSGNLKSEAAGFSAGHVPNMIPCMGYTNEQHIFRLAIGYMNRHQELDINSCLAWTGSTNYGPWATFSPKLVFANKILSKHPLIYLHIVYNCFPTTMAELSSCDRGHMDHKA